jgi:uncharacterized protein YecE (DUF72 family)
MLAYYAERLPTVEINYAFRAMPRPELAIRLQTLIEKD